MKFLKNLINLLVVPFTFLVTSRPANAFNLVYTNFPTSFDYQPIASYKTTVGNDGIVTRDYLRKIPPPSTKSAFWNLLTPSFSTWDFRRSGVPVYGDFLINKYRVCPPNSDCGALTLKGSVGSELNLTYKPNLTLFPNTRQPNPENGNVRWIQWVRSNHSLLTNKHNDKESVIDIDTKNYNGTSYFSDPGTPFYYSKISSQQTNPVYKFEDLPNRVDIGQNHDWIADLYLTEEITKPGSNIRKVLIYGGVRWGWHNRVVEKKKEPNPVPGLCPANNSSGECPPPPPPCNGSSGGGGCNKNVAADQNQYQEQSDVEQNDINSLPYQSVSFIDFDYTNWLTEEEYQSYFGMDNAPWWIENEELSEDDINDPTWWTQEQDRLYFSEYYGDNSESSTSVPESTSVLGLFALSVWSIISALKIKKSQ